MTTSKVKTGIDAAFSRPLRPVFVVTRHGYRKRCLSRDTALWALAKFMTRKVFQHSGFAAEYESIREVRPEGEVWVSQGPTLHFTSALGRCVRRLRRLLAHKREIQQWQEKHDVLTEQYREFMKTKPF